MIKLFISAGESRKIRDQLKLSQRLFRENQPAESFFDFAPKTSFNMD